MPRSITPRSTTCDCCGVTLRRDSEGFNIQLCQRCFDEAGYENAHNDGHHALDGIDMSQTDALARLAAEQAACHICSGRDPHATVRLGAAAGAGRVASEADGRLKANAPVVPETAKRVRIVTQCGRNTKFAGLTGSVIIHEREIWNKVKIDGVTQVRWFHDADLKKTTVRAPQAS